MGIYGLYCIRGGEEVLVREGGWLGLRLANIRFGIIIINNILTNVVINKLVDVIFQPKCD